MYRVLVIPGARDAAGGSLDLETEIMLLANVASGSGKISVDIIPPERSTELLIVEKLTTGNVEYDAVHWLGHTDNDGFYLSQHDQLTEERIHAICRDAGARTVFFNSCESGRIGQYLVNKQVAVCLCYSAVVLDKQAILNALRFYTALAKSNDPFRDGLRDAYLAADPGDGSLLWLTNGQYIKQIIEPLVQLINELMDQLKKMAGQHNDSFNGFNSAIESTKNALKSLDSRVSQKITQLSSNAARTRYSLIAVLVVIVLFTVVLAWSASTFGSVFAQTIPPTRIGGTIPPIPDHPTRKPTPVPPTKKPKPTRKPTPIHPTRKPTPIPPTRKPEPTPIPPTRKPEPTEEPTRKPEPTEEPTRKPEPTEEPTRKPEPTKEPTRKPEPTVTIIAIPTSTETPTPTLFQLAVDAAVQATIASWSGCACQ